MKRRPARAKWCDRTLLQSQFIGLCVSERQFHHELQKLKIEPSDWPHFTANGHAATHFLENHKLGRIAIVCIKPRRDKSLEQHYALLVHEGTHIWQNERRYINEKEPGDEIEAYAIQNIAQGLMVAFRKMR